MNVLRFVCLWPAVGLLSCAVGSPAHASSGEAGDYPHIPEPMVFDMMRPLGARQGEREANVLASSPLSESDRKTEWAPEAELTTLLLAWTSAQAPVLSRRRSFGRRFGLPALLAELRSHPVFAAQEALQQRWQVEIGIQLGEVQSESRWADFYDVQISGFGTFQPLGGMRPEGNLDAAAQTDHQAMHALVITGGYRLWPVLLQCRCTGIGLFECFMADHGSPAIKKVNKGVHTFLPALTRLVGRIHD